MMNTPHHAPGDPEKKERGIAENERANHVAFDKQQQYNDSDDDDIRETDDPDEVDREGGDLAGTAAGGMDDDDA